MSMFPVFNKTTIKIAAAGVTARDQLLYLCRELDPQNTRTTVMYALPKKNMAKYLTVLTSQKL